jgi:hypothetical protein
MEDDTESLIDKKPQIGKYKVICCGRGLLPIDWGTTVWTWLLILVPSTLQIFCVNS